MPKPASHIPYVPRDEEKTFALGHVFYEILQLSTNCLVLLRPNLNPVMETIHLEAMLLHVRTLLDFFQQTKRGINRREGRELDDVLCSDLGFAAHPVDVPEGTKDRLNTELVHISYTRSKRITRAQKEWPLKPFEPLVVRCLEFVDSRSDEEIRRCDDLRRFHGMPTISWPGLRAQLVQVQKLLKR